MSDESKTEPAEAAKSRKKGGEAKAPSRKKRHYAEEYRELSRKVDTFVRLVRAAKEAMGTQNAPVAVAESLLAVALKDFPEE